MSEKESVEQLAERIACNDVGGNYKSLDVERVTMSLQDFLRSHNIDPTTMQPMDNGEKGCTVNKYETAWLIEAQNRVGGIPIWYAGLGVSGSCLGKHGWTTDACNAMRFATKKTAESFIRLQGFDAIATEHGFDSTTVEQLQEGRDYAEIDVPTPPTRDRAIAEQLKYYSEDCRYRQVHFQADKALEILKPLRDEHEQVKAELERVRANQEIDLACLKESNRLLAESRERVKQLEKESKLLSDVGAALLDDIMCRITSDYLAKEHPQPTPSAGGTS